MRAPAVALVVVLLAGGARAQDAVALTTTAAITTTIAAGPLELQVHVSRTAQVFHVVDQLSGWSPFCHAQYADELWLSDAEKALLARYAKVRERLGWGGGLEQAFYSAGSIAAATSSAVAAGTLSEADATAVRAVLEAFAPRLDPLLARATPRLEAFVRRLVGQAPRIAAVAGKLVRLCAVEGPVRVPVFPIWNPSPGSLGGGFNGGRLTVEVPVAKDALPTFLHECFHAILDRRADALGAAAEKGGLEEETLNEGIAYALMPGLIHEGPEGSDPLADEVARGRGRGLEDPDVRFNRLGLEVRPLLAKALEGGVPFERLLEQCVAAWERVRRGS